MKAAEGERRNTILWVFCICNDFLNRYKHCLLQHEHAFVSTLRFASIHRGTSTAHHFTGGIVLHHFTGILVLHHFTGGLVLHHVTKVLVLHHFTGVPVLDPFTQQRGHAGERDADLGST